MSSSWRREDDQPTQAGTEEAEDTDETGNADESDVVTDEQVFAFELSRIESRAAWNTSFSMGSDQSSAASDHSDDSTFQYFKGRDAFNRMRDSCTPVSIYSLNGSEMNLHQPRPNHWRYLDLGTLKYVEDFLACEKLALVNAYKIFYHHKTKSIIHASSCERFYLSLIHI